MIYPDGSTYKGEWRNDKRNGHGEFKWLNNSSYVGDFRDDLMHGEGTYTGEDGTNY